MKITIIYGTARESSTYNYVQLLLNQLESNINLDLTEFFLPEDLPHFCTKCFSCYINVTENICSHFNDIEPIMTSLEKADLIILASSTYSLDISNQMKDILEHVSYRWMPHRKNTPSMINKLGLIISTTVGTDLHHTNRIMKNNLKFWGIKKIFKISNVISPMGLEIIDFARMHNVSKEIYITSDKILTSLNKLGKSRSPLFANAIFSSMKSLDKSNHLGNH